MEEVAQRALANEATVLRDARRARVANGDDGFDAMQAEGFEPVVHDRLCRGARHAPPPGRPIEGVPDLRALVKREEVVVPDGAHRVG